MGPFTQEDPIGLAGGLNLYGYANGDPVNFSDPFGLCPDGCVAEAAVFVGLAAAVTSAILITQGEELGSAMDQGFRAGVQAGSDFVQRVGNKVKHWIGVAMSALTFGRRPGAAAETK